MQQEVELRMERGSAAIEATFEDTEPLANLLSLSYEPMLAWRLDGAIKFWNAGAERLYGFALDEHGLHQWQVHRAGVDGASIDPARLPLAAERRSRRLLA